MPMFVCGEPRIDRLPYGGTIAAEPHRRAIATGQLALLGVERLAVLSLEDDEAIDLSSAEETCVGR